jgi:hypothetical protein
VVDGIQQRGGGMKLLTCLIRLLMHGFGALANRFSGYISMFSKINANAWNETQPDDIPVANIHVDRIARVNRKLLEDTVNAYIEGVKGFTVHKFRKN